MLPQINADERRNNLRNSAISGGEIGWYGYNTDQRKFCVSAPLLDHVWENPLESARNKNPPPPIQNSNLLHAQKNAPAD